MKAGTLRHRISLYNHIRTDDGEGGQTSTYSLKGSCFAEITTAIPSGNNEQYLDRKLTGVDYFKITTRFNNGLTFKLTDVITFGSRMFLVKGVSNKLEHNFLLSVFAVEIDGFDGTITSESGVFNQEGIAVYNQDGLAVYNQEGV
jgi:head-tail adaptor